MFGISSYTNGRLFCTARVPNTGRPFSFVHRSGAENIPMNRGA
jgi:hypothetical protein